VNRDRHTARKLELVALGNSNNQDPDLLKPKFAIFQAEL